MSRWSLGILTVTPILVMAAAPEDALRPVWKDPRLKLHQESVQIVTAAKSVNPLEKADLRIDRGQLEQDDVKYALRFYPKGATEHRTTQEFQSSLEKNERAAHAAMLSRLLAHRYDLLARVALYKEKKEITDRFGQVNKRTSQALSYSAQKNRSELKAYLKNKADLDKINIKIADIERDYEKLQAELKDLSLGSVESFDLTDFASIQDLKPKLEAAASMESSKTFSAQTAELDLDASRAEMDYERAKDEKWFDHVEVSISDIQKETIYGFEFAFNLPFASAPNLTRVGKEARDLRDKARLIETLKISDREFKNSLIELRTLMKVHETLQSSLSAMSPEQLRKASNSVSATDPMLALELQRGWYESREQLLDLEYRIRTLYILYLHESATLANQPDVNHLSKTLKRIL